MASFVLELPGANYTRVDDGTNAYARWDWPAALTAPEFPAALTPSGETRKLRRLLLDLDNNRVVLHITESATGQFSDPGADLSAAWEGFQGVTRLRIEAGASRYDLPYIADSAEPYIYLLSGADATALRTFFDTLAASDQDATATFWDGQGTSPFIEVRDGAAALEAGTPHLGATGHAQVHAAIALTAGTPHLGAAVTRIQPPTGLAALPQDFNLANSGSTAFTTTAADGARLDTLLVEHAELIDSQLNLSVGGGAGSRYYQVDVRAFSQQFSSNVDFLAEIEERAKLTVYQTDNRPRSGDRPPGDGIERIMWSAAFVDMSDPYRWPITDEEYASGILFGQTSVATRLRIELAEVRMEFLAGTPALEIDAQAVTNVRTGSATATAGTPSARAEGRDVTVVRRVSIAFAAGTPALVPVVSSFTQIRRTRVEFQAGEPASVVAGTLGRDGTLQFTTGPPAMAVTGGLGRGAKPVLTAGTPQARATGRVRITRRKAVLTFTAGTPRIIERSGAINFGTASFRAGTPRLRARPSAILFSRLGFRAGTPDVRIETEVKPAPNTTWRAGIPRMAAYARTYRIPGAPEHRYQFDARSLTGELPVHALEITHDLLRSPVRVVNDTVEHVVAGSTYTPLAFRLTPPQRMEGQVPTGEVEIDNVGREIMEWVNASSGGRGALVRILTLVRPAATETESAVVGEVPRLTFSKIQATLNVISGGLVQHIGQVRPGMKVRYDPVSVPGLF